MAIMHDFPLRGSSHGAMSSTCLEDKFEIIKDIGDGSFGSVTLARVRSAGANVARRGTMVAIKTMKKTFESFTPCLELREVIFLRSLPQHPHLVPALDIFLDPTSKKLHICMEYMDGNLYQLMKARDHKCLDGASVKSILYQILAGLDHIHAHNFFHRDIKPENILVSTSVPQESGLTFRRYSSISTPPSTPPVYSIKIADFGLARETQSRLPYTTYVSTRWYRAPEVLLRAGEYSAPVDMWAIGAMAVEIATLKPLFPGGNEVDQVWRVCEIMGSPGNWYNKAGGKVGGGDWRDGTKLASKLGFSFPKMAPHSMETILQPTNWPVALSQFVTWCLMWDPKNRPTSTQAMNHEYFTDAIDPLRPKMSTTRILGRKHSSYDTKAQKDALETHPLTSKPSWFRKSLIGRDSASIVPQQSSNTQPVLPYPSPVHSNTIPENAAPKPRLNASKRATWANGTTPLVGAPMHILPSIRPISPLSATVTARANSTLTSDVVDQNQKAPKKIGRQLSVASNGDHYTNVHRQEAERALNGYGSVASPTNGQKESFFSHLRKRARRLSGRHQVPLSPKYDDIEANAGCAPWSSNRSSMAVDTNTMADTASRTDFAELDRALQNVRYSIEASSPAAQGQHSQSHKHNSTNTATSPALKRHHSISRIQPHRSVDDLQTTDVITPGPISGRTRRALQLSMHPAHRYETPDEEDELLDEALRDVQRAVKGTNRADRGDPNGLRNVLETKDLNRPLQHPASNNVVSNPYPTPSPSAKRNGMLFNESLLGEPATPLNVSKARPQGYISTMCPTPPYEGYEDNEWVASATADIFAVSSHYR